MKELVEAVLMQNGPEERIIRKYWCVMALLVQKVKCLVAFHLEQWTKGLQKMEFFFAIKEAPLSGQRESGCRPLRSLNRKLPS